jgi:hypothetical protein
VKKHTFLYLTDNLVAYVSWRSAWEIWLKQVDKEEDDYTITGMEAETHLGKIYLGQAAVNVDEFELESILKE